MRNCFEKSKRDTSLFKDIALPMIFFFAILFFLFTGLRSISETTQNEQHKATRQAIVRATVHCYAIEGSYPQSLDYLKERYGLAIDEKNYIVDYNCFASNLMPDITVLKRSELE